METNKIQVAIADDHAIFRAGLKQLVESFESYTVSVEAADGAELIEKLTGCEHIPSICILDVSMPGMNGYDTIIELKKKWPDIKVLILTMLNNEYAIIKMLRGGANGYLLKGTNPKELERALAIILTGRIYLSELVSGRLYKHVAEHDERELLLDISRREQDFLKLCTNELTYAEIAAKMGVSVRTVESYRDSLFSKFNIKTRTGLVVYALRCGIASVD